MIGIGLLAVAAGLAYLRTNDPPGPEIPTGESTTRSQSHRSLSPLAPSPAHLAHLTLSDVREELTEYGRIVLNNEHFDEDNRAEGQRFERLLRRLGELEGEAALDEVLNMRGKAHVRALALAHVLAGWLRADPQAADRAFREMLGLNSRRRYHVNAITWRGKTVFNPWETLTVNRFISLILEERTKLDPKAGRSLMMDTLWSRNINWEAGLTGYLDGLRGRHDWLKVHEEFRELISKGPAGSGEPARVSQDAGYQNFVHNRERNLDWIIARRWARDDLPAALKWYAKDRPHERSPSDRALEILGALPPEQRSQINEWLVTHNTAVTADENLPFAYVRTYHSILPNQDLLQLLTALPSESQRASIVTHFVSAQESSKGTLRYQPDDLLELLHSAQLSPKDHARLQKDISSNLPEETPAENR